MKDNILVSIIVPIYNTEKYLKRALDSIINQTYKKLQIILIDDGSTDSSKDICKEYQNKDGRIEYYYEENGGLSKAKNFGLSKVRGQYITFVDSDDVLNLNFINDVLEVIDKEDADLVICENEVFTDNEYENINIKKNKSDNKKYNVVDKSSALRECFRCKKYNIASWSKIYAKNIFQKIKFPEYREMEDWATIVDIIITAKKIAMLEYSYYYYYQREGSIIHKRFRRSDLLLEPIFERNYKLVKEHFPELSVQAKCNVIGNSFYILDKIYKFDEEKEYADVIEEEVKKIKKEAKFIIFKSTFKIERKIAYIFLLINKNIYKKFVKIKNKM